MLDSPEFLLKLKAWKESVAEKKKQEDLEAQLREELFKEAFPIEAAKQDSKGTFREDLPNGWKLQAVTKLTAKLDEAAVPAIKTRLLELKVSNLDALFKYKPSLVAAEYKKLNAESKAIVDEAIEEKPAKVVLELVAPKLEDESK
jgi:hypothetical protein